MQIAPARSFTESDVRASFPQAFAQKGFDAYRKGAVLETSLQVCDGEVTGRVLGRGANVFTVSAEVVWNGDRPEFFTSCSCRDEFCCSHAAALLYCVANEPRLMSALPSHEIPESSRPLDSLLLHSFPPAICSARFQQPPATPVELPEQLSNWLEKAAPLLAPTSSPQMAPTHEILYILGSIDIDGRPWADIQTLLRKSSRTARRGKTEIVSFEFLARRGLDCVTNEDAQIGSVLAAAKLSALIENSDWTGTPDDSEIARVTLSRLIGTGRCHWQSTDNPPLRLGLPRPSRLGWDISPDGSQKPRLETDKERVAVLWCSSPWYVDENTWESGPLELPLSHNLVELFLSIPPLRPEDAALFWARLESVAGTSYFPAPALESKVEVVSRSPVPCLHLKGAVATSEPFTGQRLPLAVLTFDYGPAHFSMTDAEEEVQRREAGKVVIFRRAIGFEEACKDHLLNGLDFDPALLSPVRPGVTGWTYGPADEIDWLFFIQDDIPELRQAGWRVHIEPDFPVRIARPQGKWSAGIAPIAGDEGWFSLELGITVDGKRHSLLKLLESFFGMLRGRNLLDAIDAFAIRDEVCLPLPDGTRVALPVERIRTIVAVLIELFDSDSADGRVSAPQLLSLLHSDPELKPNWARGAEKLMQLSERLKRFEGITQAKAPQSLRGQLRDYQTEGLSWLQFLREFNLGGILADDMGLGKTIQTLSHLLLEKESGRLTKPCLVVCPTSVIPNWIAELERFAPALRVLRLHGGERSALIGQIPECDVVITSYSLVPRDSRHLVAQNWHAVVLDEAQMIKNHATKVAQTVCKLKANHRICLTGTPVENHLGELWSQFNFLLPGALGDHKTFTRVFRRPIEKQNDCDRQEVLASRLRPFMLRRTKEQVAPELPEKSTIVTRLELEGDQRDLYETIRSAMHDKVQNEIRAKGLNRSQIIILDALLKLRQVCCDPRLVKLDEARLVKSSAKLDALMSMLPDLVEEGRRVLLFSQFTTMLDLIEQECGTRGIEFVKLRGDTADRETPVRRFQAGEVPLFLISLRAGGKGINLTAADTVIHYDPWWNPAAEDQATDRAYRIGQDKNVFVYKLIAAGTVEERMLTLQERKRTLAEGVFDRRKADKLHFDESDLALLFSPLGMC